MILFLKYKWFDMIESGEKKEEYRDYKKYYTARLKTFFQENKFKKPAIIELRRGYSKRAMKIECLDIFYYHAEPTLFAPGSTAQSALDNRPGNFQLLPEWGFDREKDLIIFKLGKKQEQVQ